MNVFSRVFLCALAGVMIAGCGSTANRSGKGNDHEVVYRGTSHDRADDHRVVYVERASPSYVYYEPAPAYREIRVRPTYRVVPVTRYYYVD